MYDHERLEIDRQRARAADGAGMRSNNEIERDAKLTQLSELADAVEDEKVGFILSELIYLLA